ncbi:hypothetical protein NVS08_17215 [Enterobacter kobei]|uniref:hypothetical protein n=1 Tax=Enterobacter kobei TaxID=208224 RepID=UPI00254BAE50|nr:hypothetical protein [Enterobacter kobei]ELT0446804.1 hypothetical protein [Enterobacter hormaechei subsp. xiangfangensis]ELX8366044.1 hypothetical protein [Enterobacter hormaechei]MDK9887291.1 hypothetical protein [Enterobacter kobei]
MSEITKDQAKDLRNAFQCWQQDYDPVEDKEQYDMFGLGMVAMDALLASLEPVSVFKIDHESSLIKHVKRVVSETNAPPAPVVPECFERLLHHAYGMTMGHDWNKGTMAGHHREKLCQAVEDCRAAAAGKGE